MVGFMTEIRIRWTFTVKETLRRSLRESLGREI